MFKIPLPIMSRYHCFRAGLIELFTLVVGVGGGRRERKNLSPATSVALRR